MSVEEVVRREGGPGPGVQDVLGNLSSDQCAPDDEEMVDAERDLAEDAQWKKIQQNTFTRWANEHLKTVHKNVGNLETDLSDGLRLIALIEVLSGKKLPKHNKRPNFLSQKLENVSVALRFLEKDEGIRIVNIDSSDIVYCKLKLILGLIWTLILHYSITMPVWEGEEKEYVQGEKGPTPKQRLLHWVQSKMPDLPIGNFTTDWNDGRAVGALVDAVAPGLCPDWQDWNPNDALQNAAEAMGLADDWLNVRQLIKPEEIINPNIDELSMMTYLSQYPSAKLKSGAPLRQRTNPNSVPPPRVRAYGPGIEPSGPVVGAPANFTVETFSAGKGDVSVIVENPRGTKEPVDIRFNNDRNLTYSISYTPRVEGQHKVSILYASREIPKSPYLVLVEGHAGDASKVTASGPGIEPEGVVVGRPTYFDIFTKDAGKGVPEVVILDAAGNKNTVPVKLRQTSQDVWRCEYASSSVGMHSVNVFFAGKPIPKSPYGVSVAPVSDAKKVRASGRGLQPKGVRVKDAADFRIYTEGAGEGKAEVRIIGPGGSNEAVSLQKISGTTYEAIYHPHKEGRHIIMITYGGQEIPRSPFEVNVGPYKESTIRAYGPGLSGGVVGYPALFSVDTNGETGALGFSIEGPSQAKIDCHDNGDGSADVRYFPTAPGEYAVHILCDDEDIPGSPYIAHVLPKSDFHPEMVECQGPGLEATGNVTNKPAEFTVDTRRAGSAPLEINVMDANYNPVDVKFRETNDGIYPCNYVPKKGAKHTVQVNYGGVPTKKSPYRVYVSQPTNPSKVQVFGPGVEDGVKSQKPTHFNVDCREAGPGDLVPESASTSKMSGKQSSSMTNLTSVSSVSSSSLASSTGGLSKKRRAPKPPVLATLSSPPQIEEETTNTDSETSTLHSPDMGGSKEPDRISKGPVQLGKEDVMPDHVRHEDARSASPASSLSSPSISASDSNPVPSTMEPSAKSKSIPSKVMMKEQRSTNTNEAVKEEKAMRDVANLDESGSSNSRSSSIPSSSNNVNNIIAPASPDSVRSRKLSSVEVEETVTSSRPPSSNTQVSSSSATSVSQTMPLPFPRRRAPTAPTSNKILSDQVGKEDMPVPYPKPKPKPRTDRKSKSLSSESSGSSPDTSLDNDAAVAPSPVHSGQLKNPLAKFGVKVLPDNVLKERAERLKRSSVPSGPASEAAENISGNTATAQANENYALKDDAQSHRKSATTKNVPIHQASKSFSSSVDTAEEYSDTGSITSFSTNKIHTNNSIGKSGLPTKPVPTLSKSDYTSQGSVRSLKQLVSSASNSAESANYDKGGYESDNLEENLDFFEPADQNGTALVNNNTTTAATRPPKVERERSLMKSVSSPPSVPTPRVKMEESQAEIAKSGKETVAAPSTKPRYLSTGSAKEGNAGKGSVSTTGEAYDSFDRVNSHPKSRARDEAAAELNAKMNRWQNMVSLNEIESRSGATQTAGSNQAHSSNSTNKPVVLPRSVDPSKQTSFLHGDYQHTKINPSEESQNEATCHSSESESSYTDSGVPATETVTPSPVNLDDVILDQDYHVGSHPEKFHSEEDGNELKHSSRRSSIQSDHSEEWMNVLETKLNKDEEAIEKMFDAVLPKSEDLSGKQGEEEDTDERDHEHGMEEAEPNFASNEYRVEKDISQELDRSNESNEKDARSELLETTVELHNAPEKDHHSEQEDGDGELSELIVSSSATPPVRKLSKSESFSHNSEFNEAKERRKSFHTGRSNAFQNSSGGSAVDLRDSEATSDFEEELVSSRPGKEKKVDDVDSKQHNHVRDDRTVSMTDLTSATDYKGLAADGSGKEKLVVDGKTASVQKATSLQQLSENESRDGTVAVDVYRKQLEMQFEQWKEEFMKTHTKPNEEIKAPTVTDQNEDSESSTIEVQAVKMTYDGTDRYLQGWLSFDITLKNFIHWAFFQVSDEDGNAIGEFVSDAEKVCRDSATAKDIIFPRPQQYLPCSAAGLQEPRVSQAVVYVAKDHLKTASGADFLTSQKGNPPELLRLRFLWKLDEYYCNRHQKLRFVIFFHSGASSEVENEMSQFRRSKWFHPNWFGVADVIPTNTDVKADCDSSLSKAMMEDKKYWITKSSPSSDDSLQTDKQPESPEDETLYKSCRTYVTRLWKFQAEAKNQPMFGGRCEKRTEKKFKPGFYQNSLEPKVPSHSKSSVDIPHDCKRNPNKDATYPEQMDKYDAYVKERREKWKKLCNEKTQCPSLNASLIPRSKTETVASIRKMMYRFVNGRYIGRSRAYHGLAMCWAFLFFIPISNVVARYFKETFLDMDVNGLRFWYVIHVGGIVWAMGMFATAISASFKVKDVFGRSWSPAAQWHVIMGWVCIALFILSIILGPIRPAGAVSRRRMMIVHAVIGFFQYLIGIYLIASSTVIPGSPSATVCYTNLSDKSSFSAAFQHKTTTLVIWWIVVEIFFHFILNRLQLIADVSWQTRRPSYFPMMPIVRLEDRRSFKFFRYRSLILLLYAAVCCIFVIVTWTRLYGHKWGECDAGPMTCTHSNNTKEGQYPEVICGRMAEIRALRQRQK